MRAISIIADSTCDLSKELLEKYQIDTFPLHIHLGEEEYKDGVNISPEEMFVDDSVSFANLKQKDIKLIYSKYEDYLQSDFTDSFNQLKLFADLIEKDTYKDTIFYI